MAYAASTVVVSLVVGVQKGGAWRLSLVLITIAAIIAIFHQSWNMAQNIEPSVSKAALVVIVQSLVTLTSGFLIAAYLLVGLRWVQILRATKRLESMQSGLGVFRWAIIIFLSVFVLVSGVLIGFSVAASDSGAGGVMSQEQASIAYQLLLAVSAVFVATMFQVASMRLNSIVDDLWDDRAKTRGWCSTCWRSLCCLQRTEKRCEQKADGTGPAPRVECMAGEPSIKPPRPKEAVAPGRSLSFALGKTGGTHAVTSLSVAIESVKTAADVEGSAAGVTTSAAKANSTDGQVAIDVVDHVADETDDVDASVTQVGSAQPDPLAERLRVIARTARIIVYGVAALVVALLSIALAAPLPAIGSAGSVQARWLTTMIGYTGLAIANHAFIKYLAMQLLGGRSLLGALRQRDQFHAAKDSGRETDLDDDLPHLSFDGDDRATRAA